MNENKYIKIIFIYKISNLRFVLAQCKNKEIFVHKLLVLILINKHNTIQLTRLAHIDHSLIVQRLVFERYCISYNL